MEYEMNCEGPEKRLTITGAYIGVLADAWCEECGWNGENLED